MTAAYLEGLQVLVYLDEINKLPTLGWRIGSHPKKQDANCPVTQSKVDFQGVLGHARQR